MALKTAGKGLECCQAGVCNWLRRPKALKHQKLDDLREL